MTQDIDAEHVLAVVENTSRANILADIIGHPHGLPTRQELDHMNPSIDSQTLSNHFDTLEDAGVIKNVSNEQHEFYYLTEQARTIFDENNLFDESEYRGAYQEISKPSEIQSLEAISRPALTVSTVHYD
jgi:DNA-binding HxlR family transcriptional regulator